MKKLVKIFFILLYFIGTSGFTVVTHYCGGEIDSISIFRNINDSDPCGCEGNSCCDPCCDDEIKNIKIEDDHTIGVKYFQSSENLISHISISLSNDISFLNDILFQTSILNLHPPGEPSYILNHSFLI
jgi:hypothetical protein